MLIVELCQLCIAFGLVYIGLKEARYRTRTYEKMSAELKRLVGINADSHDYFDLLKKDPYFSECHHKIVAFMGMLPLKYVVEILDLNLPSTTKGKDKNLGWIHTMYRFFNFNMDNYIVLAVAIIGPTLIVCGLHVHSISSAIMFSETILWFITAYLFVALVIPLVFILFGKYMIASFTKELKLTREYIMKELGSSETIKT